MKIYVFGNPDVSIDNQALRAAEYIQAHTDETLNSIEFIYTAPNADVPFTNEPRVIIMDTIAGLTTVKVLTETELEHLVLPPRNSVHDFDLGFQLKYLKKLGKINRVTIIGIPMTGPVDYDSIQSILRKLVAQDMQGS